MSVIESCARAAFSAAGIPKSRISDRIQLDDGLLIPCSPIGNLFIGSTLQEQHSYLLEGVGAHPLVSVATVSNI